MPVARMFFGLLLALASVAVLAFGGRWERLGEFPFLVILASLCTFVAAFFAASRPLRIAGGPILAVALVPIGAMLIAVYAGFQITIPLVGAFLLVGIGFFLRGAGRLDVRRIARDLTSPLELDRARGIRDLRFLVRAHHQPALRAATELLKAAQDSPDAHVAEEARRLLEDASGTQGVVRRQDGLDELYDDEASAPEALAPGQADREHEQAPPPPTVGELIAVLRAGEPGACREAVRRLVAIGPAAVPALRTARAEAAGDVRVDIDLALAAIRGAPGDGPPLDTSV